MSVNLGLSEDRQAAASPRAVEFGRLLRSTIEGYRREHPDVTTRDLENAMSSAAAEEVRDDAGAPVPMFFPDEGESSRVRAVTAVLVILIVVAMTAAMLLVRRPS